jgi:hypothetical protein
LEDRAAEYGFEEAEKADYGSFQVTAERFKDSTGAYAALQEAGPKAIQASNYVVTCTGACPKDLSALIGHLPKLVRAPLPTLPGYLPDKKLIAHSERYILGPWGLAKWAPWISASALAFQYGPEGVIGRYSLPGGEQTLAIFTYPTPQMARQQVAELQKTPNLVVSRSGPLVALVPSTRGAPLLTAVQYQASLSWDEKPPVEVKPQSVAQMMLAIFTLAGIVLVFCVLAGLGFAGFRILRKRFGNGDALDGMIVLHLSDK